MPCGSLRPKSCVSRSSLGGTVQAEGSAPEDLRACPGHRRRREKAMDSERLLLTSVPTGDPRVDAAIAGLSALADTDLADRPAILEEVHDRLREILGELGDAGRPGQAGPVRPGEPGRRGEQDELGGAVQPGGHQPRPGPPRPGVPGPSSWPRRPNA